MTGWLLNKLAWCAVALAACDLCKRYESKCREAERNESEAKDYKKLCNTMARRIAALEERVEKSCKNCMFWDGSVNCCNYMILTGERRPRSQVGKCLAWRFDYRRKDNG